MLEPQHVLVTGANGYIGAHVVKALLDMGMRVTAVSMHGDHVDPRATFVACDVLARSGDGALYAELGSPQACIHLGYRNGFSHNAPTHLEDLPGHYGFVRAMAEAGCPRVALMGSMHEVGYHEGAICASTPCSPLSLYGVAKNALREAVMGVLDAQVPTCFRWLRGYYIYGDDLRSQSIFGKMVRAAQEGRRTFPFTSGRNRYDFIHIDDLAVQIAVAALCPGGSQTVNCCTGEPVALKDQALRFIEQNSLGLELEYGAFPDRPYDSPVTYGDAAPMRAMMFDAARSAQGPAREVVARTCAHLGWHEEGEGR